ncbi:hypothetical protein BCR36DRAFT_371208 [Piromyces finnis]|uniref:Uncharacterized protein n=1 Tax=Piromyces finnis TaxID=1754191 RepID=A0A1Y1V860_9FUNG|nr:hypothetical protein BCR36DRAFT_371208 [Piromyces finnis]|eukprot:ORX48720.1 hypothetical protein BCR36DRAFT_371208 [Piromyces finnis]
MEEVENNINQVKSNSIKSDDLLLLEKATTLNISNIEKSKREINTIKNQLKIKALELEIENKSSPNNKESAESNNKLIELQEVYEDLLLKYEELQENCKNPKIAKFLKDIAEIKQQLHSLSHLHINDITNEYKFLVQRNPNTECLFNNDFQQLNPETDITLGNISFFREIPSFIGTSTLDERELENNKCLEVKLN